MIIAKSEGRFGNQLFQYSGILAASHARERIVLFGFEDLQTFLRPGQAPRIKFLRKGVFSVFNQQLKVLADRGLLGRIVRIPAPDQGLARQTGFFGIMVFEAGYCQAEGIVKSAEESQEFPAVSNSARDMATDPNTEATCFVHVRRGDYDSWPSEKDAAALPLDWFQTQIKLVKARLPRVRFLVFSDDVDFARPLCQDSSVALFEGDWLDSFLTMSECDAGILSPSTFSWWAAYFSHASGKRGPFLAPEYWGGWQTREWYPPEIETSFLEYVSVFIPGE